MQKPSQAQSFEESTLAGFGWEKLLLTAQRLGLSAFSVSF